MTKTSNDSNDIAVISFDPSVTIPSITMSEDNKQSFMDGDASTSTLGADESMRHDIVLNDDGSNPEAPFLQKLEASLLMSAYDDSESSSESSYWSSSEDSDSEEDDEDDSDEDDKEEVEEDNGGENNQNNHKAEDEEHARRNRNKRSDSILSLDALLKVSMQLGDTKKAPVSREVRRRGRRLNRDHTVTSLGALARTVGSSTYDNDLKEVVSSSSNMLRSESATRLPSGKAKLMHYQQKGSPQQPPQQSGGASATSTTSASLHRQSVPSSSTIINHYGPSPVKRSSVIKYGEHATNIVKPRDHYLSILKRAGIPATLIPYNHLVDFFVPVTPQDRAAFDMVLVQAVRDQNLTKLQELHDTGHRLSARAQFGESIVHICTRRGTPEMLRYLLEDAAVSPRVCCDYGRTPLHDAAWSTDAKSLKMMQILIAACPDLLLILDRRGFMPLDYIPKDRWPHCCAFLDKYKESLLPTGVLFGEDSEEEDSDSDGSDDGQSSGSDLDI